MWKVGQEVWDVLAGKGKVVHVSGYLKVSFYDGLVTKNYTLGGCRAGDLKRALFFSEPKVEGATEPPFVPVFQTGNRVVIRPQTGKQKVSVETVAYETEECIFFKMDGHYIWKKDYHIYKLGEKVY